MTTHQMTTQTPAVLSVERAAKMLAECKAVDEAKEIRDQAKAVQVYLRTKAAGREAANDAAEIVIIAERRMGSLLRDTVKHPGGRRPTGKTGSGMESVKPATLADIGVSKKESMRAQRLADLPEDVFHEKLAEARAANSLNAQTVLGKTPPPSLQTRRTPRWLFDALASVHGASFALDAYASTHDALCERFYTVEEDGHAQPWFDVTFANPQFDEMAKATEKAATEADERGVRSVVLGPVGCSQEWYHRWAIRGTILVPDRRIDYDLPDGGKASGRADRDTIVMAFGGKLVNQHWQQGQFRVHALKVKGE